MKHKIALSSLSLMLAIPANAEPSDNPPLPSWVHSEFTSMMQSCLPGEDKIKFKNRKPKEEPLVPTAILSDLQVPVGWSYMDFGTGNMTRLFGYVYNDLEWQNLSATSKNSPFPTRPKFDSRILN